MSFLTSFQNSVIAKEADLIVAKGEERRSQCMGKRFGGK